MQCRKIAKGKYVGGGGCVKRCVFEGNVFECSVTCAGMSKWDGDGQWWGVVVAKEGATERGSASER